MLTDAVAQIPNLIMTLLAPRTPPTRSRRLTEAGVPGIVGAAAIAITTGVWGAPLMGRVARHGDRICSTPMAKPTPRAPPGLAGRAGSSARGFRADSGWRARASCDDPRSTLPPPVGAEEVFLVTDAMATGRLLISPALALKTDARICARDGRLTLTERDAGRGRPEPLLKPCALACMKRWASLSERSLAAPR